LLHPDVNLDQKIYIVPPLTTRISRETTGGERWNITGKVQYVALAEVHPGALATGPYRKEEENEPGKWTV
jgi:hypothetical protein